MDPKEESTEAGKTRIKQFDPNLRRKVTSAPVLSTRATTGDDTDGVSDFDDESDQKGPEINTDTLESCLVETTETEDEGEIRIVLVGKTGSGKSTTGNTLLGKQFFKAQFSAQSVTNECFRGESVIHGRKIVVVDTPGLFDTKLSATEIKENIIRCVHMSFPGPHIFLLVIRAGRFTKEENESLNNLFEIFGKSMKRCSILVFTGLDNVESDGKTIDDFIKDAGEPLSKHINQFRGRYFAINNMANDEIKSSTVKLLLQLMDETVKTNEGKCFSNQLVRLAAENIMRAIGLVKEKYNKKIEDAKNESEERKKKMLEEIRNQTVENRRNQLKDNLDAIYTQKAAEIQINAAMKRAEIQSEQKRQIQETIKRVTQDTSKNISSYLSLLKEKNDAIFRVRENMKKATGDVQSQKLLAEEEQKLTKEKKDIIRERDECISSMVHKSSLLQRQLIKKDKKICPIM